MRFFHEKTGNRTHRAGQKTNVEEESLDASEGGGLGVEKGVQKVFIRKSTKSKSEKVGKHESVVKGGMRTRKGNI